MYRSTYSAVFFIIFYSIFYPCGALPGTLLLTFRERQFSTWRGEGDGERVRRRARRFCRHTVPPFRIPGREKRFFSPYAGASPCSSGGWHPGGDPQIWDHPCWSGVTSSEPGGGFCAHQPWLRVKCTSDLVGGAPLFIHPWSTSLGRPNSHPPLCEAAHFSSTPGKGS